MSNKKEKDIKTKDNDKDVKSKIEEKVIETRNKVEEVTTKKRFKNYCILIVVFILTICLTLYLCKIYKTYDEYKKLTPVIRGTLQEIVSEDLEHYILENPTTIIYMCTSNSDSCRSFEKDFKKFVVKEDYTNDIVYLNLTNLDQEQFIEEFNSKYNFKIKLNSDYPAIVLFENGTIDALLQGNDNKKLTVSKVKDFLDLNTVTE